MKRLTFIFGCALALTVTITYFVLVDGSSRESLNLKSLSDFELGQSIHKMEADPHAAALAGQIGRFRREQALRRYIPAWADGRTQ